MKFQPDSLPGTNVVTRHEPGSVWVGARSFSRSLLIPWNGEVREWPPATPEQLEAAHFEAILALGPELVIFGSGERQRFVSPSLYRSLIGQRVGIETMDTGAACRTYNVLASEGRRVVAALLVSPKPQVANTTIIGG